MKTKKILSFLLVFAMLSAVWTVPVISYASDGTGSVLLLIKERIPDTSAYTEFDSSVNERNGYSVYQFNWSAENDGTYSSMSATSTSDGIITSYSAYSSKTDVKSGLTIDKMSSDEALLKATDLADKLNPSLAGSIKLINNNKYESLANNGYSFSLQRLENGIEVYGDSGNITVNSDCTKIENYYINYTQGIDFKSAQSVISKEAAIENYAGKIGMELYYSSRYNTSDDKTVYLSYRPAIDGVYIDAVSGDTVKPVRSYGYRTFGASKNEAAMDSASGGGFSEAEIANLEELAGLISVAEAEKIVKSNKYVLSKDSLKLKSSHTYKNYNGNYVYNLQFDSGDKGRMLHVTLNAQNGEIISLNQYSGVYSEEEDKEVQMQTLKDAVSYFAPGKYKSDESGEYRFYKQNGNSAEFIRYINDIPYYENNITVRINSSDMSLSGYTLNHTDDIMFESPEGIISADEACGALFNHFDYTLCYYPCISSEDKDHNDTAELVYKLEDGLCEIYAVGGDAVRYSDDVGIGNYNDISGHYAEDIINLLSEFGIGFESDSFCPDDTITQKEFVALLTSVVSGSGSVVFTDDTDYEAYYRMAQNKNILPDGEKTPDTALTREAACIYFIRAIGLEEAAKLQNIYIPQFSDVTSNIGYISILSAMGVVGGYNGIFSPEKMLSRADAMIMIYNYLRRQSK